VRWDDPSQARAIAKMKHLIMSNDGAHIYAFTYSASGLLGKINPTILDDSVSRGERRFIEIVT
jgi:hypothetical protein